MASDQRLIIPALDGLYRGLGDWSETLLRVALGGILMPHGLQKLVGLFGGMGLAGNAALFDKLGYSPGMFWGTLVGCTELIGGALLVLGLLTRPAALALAIFCANAVLFTSKSGGFFWTKGGSEFAILLLAGAVYFLIRGARTHSLDRAIGQEF